MGHTLTLRSLLDVVYAAHLSSYVQYPLEERGGIVLVGPPGVLKSAILNVLERHYVNVVELSDLNVQQFVKEMRDPVASGEIRTIVFPELEKLYERHQNTAANLEGILRALVAEGFKAASWEPKRLARLTARCLVLGAMVPQVRDDHHERWSKTGFERRFLWPLIRLSSGSLAVMRQTVVQQQLVDFQDTVFPPEPAGDIPNQTTPEERTRLLDLLGHQPGPHTAQHHLLVKILSVLKWWYTGLGRVEGEAWRTILEFAGALSNSGAELVLPPIRQAILGPGAAVVATVRRQRRRERRRQRRTQRKKA